MPGNGNTDANGSDSSLESARGPGPGPSPGYPKRSMKAQTSIHPTVLHPQQKIQTRAKLPRLKMRSRRSTERMKKNEEKQGRARKDEVSCTHYIDVYGSNDYRNLPEKSQK